MANRLGFLTTRVGRRLLTHFLSAALLPMLAVAAVGFWNVRDTLADEAQQRVARLAKSAALTLLGALDAERRLPASAADGANATLPTLPTPSHDAEAHMAQGAPWLVVHPSTEPEGDAILEFVRRDGQGALSRQPLDGGHLWSALGEVVQGERSYFCVFAGRAAVRVRCSSETPSATVARLREIALASAGNSGSTMADDFVFGHRQLFLRYTYGADEWRLVTAESKADVLAPLTTLMRTLALLVALAVVLAFTLGHRQIRRSTEPLVALDAGTARIAAGDLSTPVMIRSGDEYAALGDAFNQMTATLADQLGLLRSMDAIDDAALRERKANAIISAAIGHLSRTPGASRVAVAMRHGTMGEKMQVTWADTAAPHARQTAAQWQPAYCAAYRASPRVVAMPLEDAVVPPCAGDGTVARRERHASAFPLAHDGELIGVITVTTDRPDGLDEATTAQVRRIADRVAIGLANTLLVDKLNALSLGAIRAFATAIDANSPWTAGHSERVTALAVRLGRAVGCSSAECDLLQRGGLLHDIGKIGIPSGLLDKAGKLTPEERALIERHPVIGEQILAPLPVFASVLPIVRSHHERFDGRGYPDRLAGTDIPWLARITSVADVFDALTSHRPYRRSLTAEQAIAMIMADSGQAFDPRVVDALVALHAAGEIGLSPAGVPLPAAVPELATEFSLA